MTKNSLTKFLFIATFLTLLFSCNTDSQDSDEAPPAEATNFTASAMDSKVLLSWEEPTDEDFCGVEISVEPKTGSLENPLTLKKGAVSLMVYELQNGTEYTFTIKTFDKSGNFSAGTTCKAKPVDLSDKIAPAEADNFTASAMDSKVLLSWENPTDTDFYGVEISVEPETESFANPQILTKDTVSIFVYNLKNGTEYTFKIRSLDVNWNFSEGVLASATPVDSSDKTPPQKLEKFKAEIQAETQGKTVLLSWENPKDGDFSGVEISCAPKTNASAGSLSNPQILAKNISSLVVYGLENNIEYEFSAKSFDTSGNFSEAVSTSIKQSVPSDATNFSAIAMDSAAKLSWTDASEDYIFGYELTWSPKATGNSSIFVSPSASGKNEITIPNLANGTEYTFTLKTVNTSGYKSQGASAKCKPVAVVDVTNLTAIYYDGKTHLSWKNPSGVAGAEIFSGGKKLGEAENVSSSIYGNYGYFSDETATPEKIYIVKAKNSSGQLSGGVAISSVETGLPVVLVKTVGIKDVEDKTNKINANINIFNSEGLENPDSNTTLTIKGRGNSSWGMPKKSYTLKLDKKSKVLGMKKHKTWAMIANYSDKTLLRNSIAYQMGREIFTNMAWNPSTKNVHFYLNGCYLGLYMLTESVKIDENRVNIKNMEDYAKDYKNDDTVKTSDYGFLLEVNARLDESFNFTTTKGVKISLKDPDGEDISTELQQIIKETTQKAEYALYSEDFSDENSNNYYAKYFDVDSFIDWWLVNEIAKNNDAIFYSSCYMYFNPTDQKLYMGPLWDFDIGFGNVNYNGCDKTDGFWIKNASWIARMFQDPAFVAKAKDRWNEKYSELSSFFNSDVKNQFTMLDSEANQNFTRWQILGTYVWANASGYENRKTYESECDFFSNWISERLEWLNTAINGL